MSTPCSNSAVCVPTNDSSKCVSRLCSPGETLCSSDFTKILRCDASGTILETSASCSVNEACQAGSCKASDHPLGNVLRTHGIDNATLSPGRYAIAVVHTDPSDDDLVPFPLEMSGPVADPPGTLALHPRTKDRTILSGTSAMLLQRPQLRAMPIDIGPLPDSPTPQDDSVRLFHVPDHASGGAITLTRTARLRASGQHVNLWEDQTTSAPGTQIPDSALPDLLHRIDQAVIPRAVVMMGQPTDVDGNGKIDILFTDVLPDAVAAFSHPSATLFAPGSFSTSYDYGEVVYSHGMSPGQPTWEVATLMSHEIAQLIYLGARLSPYLEDDPASVPAWVHADIYAVEGLASIAMGWSGQSWAWPAVKALEHPEEMSLWRLTASSYLTDPMTNLASYGFGTLVQEYLFDQAGALKVKGSVFEDAGGLAYIDAFTNHQSGWERIGPLDGRPLSEWYVDFAVALLVHGLQEKVSTETALDTRFVFAETIEDTVWGGFIGPTLRYDHMLDTTETGPILSPVAWSHRPSKLRRGGVCFLAFDVGEAGAMLTLTDALTTVAVMRYVP